jgi:hypothetical protein
MVSLTQRQFLETLHQNIDNPSVLRSQFDLMKDEIMLNSPIEQEQEQASITKGAPYVAEWISYQGSRDLIRLMVEYGADCQLISSKRVLNWFFHTSKPDDDTYPTIVAMFQDLSDYDNIVGNSPSHYVRSTTSDNSRFRLVMLYLNYHGSLAGFQFALTFYLKTDSNTFDRFLLILQKDLCSDEERRDLYMLFMRDRVSFHGIYIISKCLHCILTEGISSDLMDQRTVMQRLCALLDPKLILETVHRLDDATTLKVLLKQFEVQMSHLPDGKLWFQHVVDFALVQGHNHANLIKVLIENFHANPNTLIPTVTCNLSRKRVVNYQMLNERYHQRLQGNDAALMKLQPEEAWNIGQLDSKGGPVQG